MKIYHYFWSNELMLNQNLLKMKNQLIGFIFLAFFVGLIFSSSCTKLEDPAETTSMTTATITGEAMANLDLSNDTNEFGGFEIQYENVPAGTVIYGRIDSEDLDATPNQFFEYEYILFNTKVSNNGKYTLEVYAGVNNVDVAVFADDFYYNQKINDSTWEWKTFSLQNQNLIVTKDIKKFEDLIFNAN